MGNCFGKPDSSSGDNNAGGARPSNNNQTPSASASGQKKKPHTTGKGRTLGEAASSGSSAVPPTAAADAARQAALVRFYPFHPSPFLVFNLHFLFFLFFFSCSFLLTPRCGGRFIHEICNFVSHARGAACLTTGFTTWDIRLPLVLPPLFFIFFYTNNGFFT